MSKSIKFPKEHYVGMIVRRQSEGTDYLPLAFMTPETHDAASVKRKASVDSWVSSNSHAYDSKTQTHYKIKQPEPVVLKNEPIAGFRLLDEIRRDSSWGSGNVKWRIEDPRGFELEISSPNLMQIMACTVLDKGEILDVCMWAREGSDNILVPVSSDVYKTAMENTERNAKSASMRDVKIGDAVVLQNGMKGTYYGRMNDWERDYRGDDSVVGLKLKLVMRHVIVDHDEKTIHRVASPKLAEIISGEEISKEEAEKLVAGFNGYKGGGGYRLTFSKVPPVVTLEPMEVKIDNVSYTFIFEVNDVLYIAERPYSDNFSAYPANRYMWENHCVITHAETYTNSNTWGIYNHRGYVTFSKSDLINRGVKCYRTQHRITFDDGTVIKNECYR